MNKWQPLTDVQWMNIVNHDSAWQSYSMEDAVHEAVKMVEAKCKDNNCNNWMPIETAPIDGTKVLAWNIEYGQRETYMGKYGEGSVGYQWFKEGKGPLQSGWVWYEPQSGWIATWKPTHWMPLPIPPKE